MAYITIKLLQTFKHEVLCAEKEEQMKVHRSVLGAHLCVQGSG